MRGAVGFDLGETLFTYADTPLSWVSLYRSALTRVAEVYGKSPNKEEFERAEKILSRYNTRLYPRSLEVTAEVIFCGILQTWEVEVGKQLELGIRAFFDFFRQRLVSYSETSAALDGLRKAGFRLGALTDVPYGMPRTFVEQDLVAANLGAALDVLLTSVDVGTRKPEPAGFHVLARELAITPTALWFVGNEEKDIAGALAAGATAVLIDRENQSPRWGQDHTIRNLNELRPLLPC